MAARGVERLLNVIMTIGSRSRIDRAQLFDVIPDYANAESVDAAEKMFERDKAAILDLGLPLVSERDPWDESRVLYRIAGGEGGALDVTPEEYTVLLAASRAWDDAAAGGAARRVRAKLLSLGIEADPDLLRRTPRGALESLPVLTPLLEAVTQRRRVTFSYRTADGRLAERTVEPWVVAVHEGRWYLWGHDADRDAPRLFRASRIETYPRLKGRAQAERPAHTSIEEALHRSDSASEQAEARLAVEPFKALALRDRLDAPLDAPELVLPEAARTQVRRLVLAESRWIALRAPEPWRRELAGIFAQIARDHEAAPDLDVLERASVRREPRIRVSPSGTDHLSRLIGEASYVLSRGEVELEQVAREFAVSTEQIIEDLQVLFVCGDLGTGWEDLIEAEWDSGLVRVRNADALRRPLRLSAPETTALLAGLATLDPAAGREAALVESARRKLSAHLGEESGQADGAVADPAAAGAFPQPDAPAPLGDPAGPGSARRTAVLDAVQDAIGAQSALVIRYSPPAAPGTTVRRIHPLELLTIGARSYVRADCELAGEERRFRIDRIVEILDADASLTRPGSGGTHADGAPSAARTDPAAPVGGAGRVEGDVWLRLGAGGLWIAEAFEAQEIRDLEGEGVLARLTRPVRAALADAVIEAAGAAEVLSPREVRDEIVTISWGGAERHAEGQSVG
ncbi:WYL domain-containing protein [Brachybacterium halotolerans subsp. kimchii]|uniref:WYL domain-containing protein n=1 Tax=Brachybacterium halotolerans TaxID=2795215 RepID=UPI001E3FD083|nr:WYL domain-containing protein [Brachybacterium halotolerans]UEJ83175.1 WYL domain-containing protein [Brachybacterium halotolerans subsp. kimchii]